MFQFRSLQSDELEKKWSSGGLEIMSNPINVNYIRELYKRDRNGCLRNLLRSILLEDISSNLRSEELYANLYNKNEVCMHLADLSGGFYMSLNENSKKRYLYLLKKLIVDNANDCEKMIEKLLRNIQAGLNRSDHISLCYELVDILNTHREWIVSMKPALVPFVFIKFLRLINEHTEHASMLAKEVDFLIFLWKNAKSQCCLIGKEVVRLCNIDLVAKVPTIAIIYNDLNIDSLRKTLLETMTHQSYLKMNVNSTIENELNRYMKTIKRGDFYSKYGPNFEKNNFPNTECFSVIPEIVRFVCSVYFPNVTDIIKRWEIIGFLVNLSSNSLSTVTISNNIRIALIFDVMTFTSTIDDLTTIESVWLFLANSIDQYGSLVANIFKFLITSIENYYPELKSLFISGVNNGLVKSVEKGLFKAVDFFLNFKELESEIKEKMLTYFQVFQPKVEKVLQKEISVDPRTPKELLWIGEEASILTIALLDKSSNETLSNSLNNVFTIILDDKAVDRCVSSMESLSSLIVTTIGQEFGFWDPTWCYSKSIKDFPRPLILLESITFASQKDKQKLLHKVLISLTSINEGTLFHILHFFTWMEVCIRNNSFGYKAYIPCSQGLLQRYKYCSASKWELFSQATINTNLSEMIDRGAYYLECLFLTFQNNSNSSIPLPLEIACLLIIPVLTSVIPSLTLGNIKILSFLCGSVSSSGVSQLVERLRMKSITLIGNKSSELVVIDSLCWPLFNQQILWKLIETETRVLDRVLDAENIEQILSSLQTHDSHEAMLNITKHLIQHIHHTKEYITKVLPLFLSLRPPNCEHTQSLLHFWSSSSVVVISSSVVDLVVNIISNGYTPSLKEKLENYIRVLFQTNSDSILFALPCIIEITNNYNNIQSNSRKRKLSNNDDEGEREIKRKKEERGEGEGEGSL